MRNQSGRAFHRGIQAVNGHSPVTISYSVSGTEAATGINYNFIYNLNDKHFVAEILIQILHSINKLVNGDKLNTALYYKISRQKFFRFESYTKILTVISEKGRN